jgi:hypothetical protein
MLFNRFIIFVFLIYAEVSLARVITVPAEPVWKSLGSGEYASQSSACSQATPEAVDLGSTIIQYKYVGVGECQTTGECDCTYTQEYIVFGNSQGESSWNGQNYINGYSVCPGGLSLVGGADFPGLCQGDPNKKTCPQLANPVHFLTGVKIQTELDHQISKDLKIKRTFNNSWRVNSRLGLGWSADFLGKKLLIGANDILMLDDSGVRESFSKNSNLWIGDSDSGAELSESVEFFILTRANGSKEIYDLSGQLLSVTKQDSRTVSYAVTDEQVTVSDSDNNYFTAFLDDSGNVYEIVSSDGFKLIYQYNEGYLKKVIYPDDTPENLLDNPYREYHYEDVFSLTQLVGITNELGVQYASWDYDVEGRAISSTHLEVDSYLFDYEHLNAVDNRVVVTNPLGKQTIYHFKNINDEKRLTWVEGQEYENTNDSNVSCAAADQYYSYDENGFKDIVVNWEGNAIDYDFDSRGLEVKRVEGLSSTVDQSIIPPTITTAITSDTYTVLTEWHPDLRLPTKITEPDRITVITYDPVNGRELSRTEYLLGNEP